MIQIAQLQGNGSLPPLVTQSEPSALSGVATDERVYREKNSQIGFILSAYTICSRPAENVASGEKTPAKNTTLHPNLVDIRI
jgi:hypothetical protein